MKYYTIYFTGETQENVNTEQLKENLCILFKADLSRIDKMFTGKPVIVKKSITAEQVKKYQQALFKAGAKVVVKEDIKERVDQKNKPDDNKKQQKDNPSNEQSNGQSNDQLSSGLAGLINYNQQSADPIEDIQSEDKNTDEQLYENSELTLCQENTGSLEEFSAKKEVFVEPDFSDYSISDANSGSLEQYAPKIIAAEIKDISYMDITDQNDRPLSDQTEKPKPADLPDTKDLSMSEPENGDLREFIKPVKPTKINDISDIKLVNNS